ncbi:MAG TPA: hypothetical protein DEA84_12405, partial [Erwinia persicina]|nr:hypothetical protein [Erwinia persicina]
ELQLNAWWASRQSHLIMLNAPALRRTQQMTENTLRALSRVIVEGDTGKMAANSEELAEITRELRQLIAESDSDELVETPIHGYVWLSLEMASQLERLTELIRLTLRK